MSKIPPDVMANDAIIAFRRAGFELLREGKKHSILRKSGHQFHLSIPRHPKPLKQGTLRSLIADAGLTVDEFVAFLR